jgi:hypothetical protein
MPKAKTRKPTPALIVDRDDSLDSIFGPPPLLDGESTAAYQALHEQITAAVKPADFIEQVWVRDFVDITWEIMRLRRLRPALIVAGYGDAIRQIVTPELGFVRAADFSDKWLRDEENTRADFKALLSELGFTMDDVHARALGHQIKVIGQVDHMIEASEHRRRLIFSEVDRRREMLARRMREEAKTIDAQLELQGAQAIAHVRAAP